MKDKFWQKVIIVLICFAIYFVPMMVASTFYKNSGGFVLFWITFGWMASLIVADYLQ